MIEPAAGLGRTVLTLLCDAYDEDEIGGEQRTVLRLLPQHGADQGRRAAAVNKDGQPEQARAIYEELRDADDRRIRHRRLDREALPAPGRDRHALGVTVDHQTMEDDTVTVRDRDTLEQVRIPAGDLASELQGRLAAPWTSPKLQG